MQSGSAASLHRYKAQTEKTHRQEHRNRLMDYSSVFATMTLFAKKKKNLLAILENMLYHSRHPLLSVHFCFTAWFISQ